MSFTIWVNMRPDRAEPSYQCNPLQSVKSVVKNLAAAISGFFLDLFLPAENFSLATTATAKPSSRRAPLSGVFVLPV